MQSSGYSGHFFSRSAGRLSHPSPVYTILHPYLARCQWIMMDVFSWAACWASSSLNLHWSKWPRDEAARAPSQWWTRPWSARSVDPNGTMLFPAGDHWIILDSYCESVEKEECWQSRSNHDKPTVDRGRGGIEVVKSYWLLQILNSGPANPPRVDSRNQRLKLTRHDQIPQLQHLQHASGSEGPALPPLFASQWWAAGSLI